MCKFCSFTVVFLRFLYFPFFPEYEFTADVFLRLLIYYLETKLFFFFISCIICWSGKAPRALDTNTKHKNTRDRGQAVMMSEIEVVGDGAGSGSSGVVLSDGGGSAVGGDGAAATSTPASDGRVLPRLYSVDATTTLHSGNGTPVTVTIVPQTSGKSAKSSCMWQVFHQFKPAILEKNVSCQDCKHLLEWKPASGTHGKSAHLITDDSKIRS